MKRYLVMVLGFYAIAGVCQAADPVVEYVRISQRSGTKLVDIEYKVTDADGDDMTISVSGRDHDNGVDVPVNTLSGDGADGETVSGGVHHLTWDAGADWGGKLTDDFRITIRATDSSGGPAPNGFVRVEGGTFTMGDTWGDGYNDETPTHDVTVSSFHMAVTEVTNQQVVDVFQWAYNNDKVSADISTVKNASGDSQELLDLDSSDCQISFSDGAFSVDDGKEDYPVVKITWYGAAAYCNFLSEKEGLMPAYDFSDWNSCDWSANGYRLPTEAEWEYAARGGQEDTDPGGDDDHKYAGSDANTSLDDVAWYNGNAGGHSHEVGTRAANELGLYDMSGNVAEWCWDWYDSEYYADDSPGADPRGPESGSDRVGRGGAWPYYDARPGRVAWRGAGRPAASGFGVGFRPVLPAGGSVPAERPEGGDATANSWEEINERWVKNIYANGDVTMSDRDTGLMWVYDAGANGEANWDNAKSKCSNLTYAGHDDWFLPDKNQLEAMYSQEAHFTNVIWSYWSSTPYNDRYAYAVNMWTGGVGYDGTYHSLELSVWPCRGGQDEGYSISGVVTGDVQEDVTVTLSGADDVSTTTDADGTYSFTGLTDGTYTLTPELNGYSFTPSDESVEIDGNDVSDVDFTAAAHTYSISGVVTGDVREGVVLTLSGAADAATSSDVDGNYTFSGLTDGSYTLAPELNGYSFTPSDESVVIDGNDVSDVDFTAVEGTGDENLVPVMVRVEGGTFTMGDKWGDDYWDDETPTHDVTVSSFHMAVTEVTNQQVADVFQWAYDRGKIADNGKNANGDSQELLDLDDSDCQISFSGGTFSVDDGKEDYPVVKITWYGAAAYCNFLSEKEGLMPAYDFSDWNSCDWSANGYRLPTEAEWEYAARGGQEDTDPGGDDDHKYAGSDANTSLDDVAWYNGNAGGHSHEVGTRAANELGIHDLSGNVYEWCWDWYDGYPSEAQTDPRGPGSGSARVVRGGGWSFIARGCRVAYRYGGRPVNSSFSIGFRPVLPAGQ